MPSEWTVSLTGPEHPAIPAEAPHAVVSRWLDTDHRAPVKPYSIAPPASRGRQTVLTVRLLDDDLAGVLLREASTGSDVRLGRHHFIVAAAPLARSVVAWPELEAAPVVRAWDVTFVTPATFRNGRRTSPWPAPSTVLDGLAARWAALRGQAPGLTREGRASVWVSDVDGRSEPLELKQTVVSGFVGRVRYVSDGTEEEAAATSALFAFAAYAGIGSHTAFGLGAVRLARTWQPRTSRTGRAPRERVGTPAPAATDPVAGRGR